MPALDFIRPGFFDASFRIKAGDQRLYKQRPLGCWQL